MPVTSSPQQTVPTPGQDWWEIAAESLGDPSRFRDLLDQNGTPPDAVFEEAVAFLGEEVPLDLPLEDLGVGGAIQELVRQPQSLKLDRKTISRLSKLLPPELAGYAQEGLEIYDEINGFIGEGFSLESSESEILEKAKGLLGDKGIFKGESYKVVDWLLSRKPDQKSGAKSSITSQLIQTAQAQVESLI